MKASLLLAALAGAVALAGARDIESSSRSLSAVAGTVRFPYHQCTLRTGAPCYFTGPTVETIPGGKEFCFTAVCPGCDGQPNPTCCEALEANYLKLVWDIQYGCVDALKAFRPFLYADGVPLGANVYINELIDDSKPPVGRAFARWTNIYKTSSELDGTEICFRAAAPCDSIDTLFVKNSAGFPKIAQIDDEDGDNGCCPSRYDSFPPPPPPKAPLTPVGKPPRSPPPPRKPSAPKAPKTPSSPREPGYPGTPASPPPPRKPSAPRSPPPPRKPSAPKAPESPLYPREPGYPGTPASPPPPRKPSAPRAPLKPVTSPPSPMAPSSPRPDDGFPYCRCSKAEALTVQPYSVSYARSFATEGFTNYCFSISVDASACSGKCCDMMLNKIEILSLPICQQSVYKFWTSVDNVMRSPAWARQYDAKLGQETAMLKLNNLGLTTATADGADVCFSIKAGSACPDLDSVCLGDDCAYAVFDKPLGCCAEDTLSWA